MKNTHRSDETRPPAFVPEAEVHVLDGGHFALDEIAGLVLDFLDHKGKR